MAKSKTPRAPSLAKKGPRHSGGRKANGRFHKGTSGNPNGRPRKEKPVAGDELFNVMNQEVMRADGTMMSAAQMMAMHLVHAGMSDPRIALKLLTAYAERARGAAASATLNESDEDDDILNGLVARLQRSRATRPVASEQPDKAGEGDDDE